MDSLPDYEREPCMARSEVPHAGKSGRTLGTFLLKAKTVFSPRFFACGTFSTVWYGNGSHSNRVTVTRDRAIGGSRRVLMRPLRSIS
jgi:hypothetical protein